MPDLIIPDTNEYHPLEQFAGPAAIIRTGYSTTHVDRAWSTDAPKAARFRWWAAYHYLKATDDPVAAADFMLSILGGYRPNVLCCDLEEGDGDQSARAAAFCARLHERIATIPDWTYSGLSFARSHNVNGGNPQWIAAYQSNEPSTAHVLWQFSDKQTFAGIGAPLDASIFRGTVDDLLALTGGAPVPQPVTIPEDNDDMLFLIQGDKSADWYLVPITKPVHMLGKDDLGKLLLAANAARAAGHPVASNDGNPIVISQAQADLLIRAA